MTPAAPATNRAATDTGRQPSDMTRLAFRFSRTACDGTASTHVAGAQTERRGGAGPVGGLLGGKDPTGRWFWRLAQFVRANPSIPITLSSQPGSDPARR